MEKIISYVIKIRESIDILAILPGAARKSIHSIIKNPQFLSNQVNIKAIIWAYESIIFTKFHNELGKNCRFIIPTFSYFRVDKIFQILLKSVCTLYK